MSSASRKVKNPLLSAAGEGFPFEDYAENALLVPVTPAAPAVLRDGESNMVKHRNTWVGLLQIRLVPLTRDSFVNDVHRDIN